MPLRNMQQQALEIAKTLADDEYVRVVRVAKRTYAIERGIGVRGGQLPTAEKRVGL